MPSVAKLLSLYAELEVRDKGVADTLSKMHAALGATAYNARLARESLRLLEQQQRDAAAASQRAAAQTAGFMMTVTGAMVSQARQALSLFAEAEAVEDRLERATRAFGNAAGYSAGQLKMMAEQAAAGSPFSKYQMEAAETQLSRFTEVRGQQFRRALEAARSMSYLTGMDPAQAARMLGIALEDPGRGSHLLRRTMGVTFTEDERKRMQSLTRSGRIEEAQDIILNKIPNVEAPQTLQAAIARLKNEFQEFGRSIGRTLAPTIRDLIEWLRGLTSWLNQLSPAARDQIIFALKLAAAMYLLGKGIQVATAAAGNMSAMLKTLSANPILAVVAAVTMLIASLWEAARAEEEYIKKSNQMTQGDPEYGEQFRNIKDPAKRKAAVEKALEETRVTQGRLFTEDSETSGIGRWFRRGPFGPSSDDTRREKIADLQKHLVELNKVKKEIDNPLLPPDRQQQQGQPVHSMGLAESYQKVQEMIFENSTDPVVDQLKEVNKNLENIANQGKGAPPKPPPMPGG